MFDLQNRHKQEFSQSANLNLGVYIQVLTKRKLLNLKWCRYCLTSLKIYHDEDQCDYNIILRERKKRKNNLCKKCGQTKAAYHQEGTDLCKKRQLIFSKLYEKFPHSVIQLGFCPKKNIFLTTHSKINFLNLTKEQRNRHIKKYFK